MEVGDGQRAIGTMQVTQTIWVKLKCITPLYPACLVLLRWAKSIHDLDREIKYDPRTISKAATIFYAAGEDWTMPSWGWDQTNFGLFSGDDVYKPCGVLSGAAVERVRTTVRCVLASSTSGGTAATVAASMAGNDGDGGDKMDEDDDDVYS